jgi:photosystem II stability/assembly factor-like uncharacterized protein
MRDEELRRRLGQVAEYGERAVSPPDPSLLYRRARRRLARLTALGVLLVCALVGGGLAVRTGLAGDEQVPAVTVPSGPPTTAVPPTTAPPGTTSAPTTEPAAAPARFPAAPPRVGDADAAVPAAQLVTPDSGWALTTDRLAWTGDGGRSWRTITPGQVPAARVRGAFFLDAQTGWVVASARRRETGSRVQLAVYRTRDAGATWKRSSLGELDLGGDNAAGGYEGGFGVLALPSFVDHRHGWVAVLTSSDTYRGHRFLFRTTDGGGTWERRQAPPGAPQVAFSGRTTGWSVVQGGAGSGGGLYRTTDAGRSWRRVGLAPPPSLRRTSVRLREPPTFKTERDGFLPVEFLRGEQGPGRILAAGFYVTADGGATWTPRYVPLAEEDEEFGLFAQAAADPRTLVALVGHEARKLLTSRDGGGRWAVGSSGLEGRYPVVLGLAYADPGTGWAVTGRGTSLDLGCNPRTPRCDDRGNLLRTGDGGTTWADATPGR